MVFDFRFRMLDSRSDLKKLVDFLMKQSLGYPNYEEWVLRAEADIDRGRKKAILGFSNGNLAADLVLHWHEKLPGVVEIKNLRVDPDFRRRDFAHFMLRQAEVENPGCLAMICDVRQNQPEAIALLRFAGYVPVCSVPLYDLNVPDNVMVKCFDKETESGIVYRSRELFLGI